MRVKDCMCHNVIQATPDTSILDVAKLMDENRFEEAIVDFYEYIKTYPKDIESLYTDISGMIYNTKNDIKNQMNNSIISLYWNIGKVINENNIWGSKFLNKLSIEIRNEFPSAKGFSVRNLQNMVKFWKKLLFPDSFLQIIEKYY